MTSLRLALRGLAARLGLSLSLLVVTSFAVAMAGTGAIYLRAAGESVLQDTLRRAPPLASGIGVDQRVASRQDLRKLDSTLRGAITVLPVFDPPLTGLETAEPTQLGGPGSKASGAPLTAKLASRSGLCDHLVVVSGRCLRPTSRRRRRCPRRWPGGCT